MDPSVVNSLSAAFGLSALRESNEQTLRIGRQSDGAAVDMRAVGAGVFRLIAQSSDPSTYADYQTSSHVPTAQPYIAPNFVNPAGGPPAVQPKAA
jgi:hypothetical protein